MTNSWALLKGMALQVTYDYLKKEDYSTETMGMWGRSRRWTTWGRSRGGGRRWASPRLVKVARSWQSARLVHSKILMLGRLRLIQAVGLNIHLITNQ